MHGITEEVAKVHKRLYEIEAELRLLTRPINCLKTPHLLCLSLLLCIDSLSCLDYVTDCLKQEWLEAKLSPWPELHFEYSTRRLEQVPILFFHKSIEILGAFCFGHLCLMQVVLYTFTYFLSYTHYIIPALLPCRVSSLYSQRRRIRRKFSPVTKRVKYLS